MMKEPNAGQRYYISNMCQHETKHCGRCQTPFECKVVNILECQCYGVTLTEVEKTFVAKNYQNCLCRACLEAIKLDVNKVFRFP
jgi:hypothetical protein